MKPIKYLFDLDGTITLEETLPLIAREFNVEEHIEKLTAATIKGEIPFIESFIRRVGILGKLPVAEVNAIVSHARLNTPLVEFINKNSDGCAILTGNYRGWIEGLVDKIGCDIHCSEGYIDENKSVKLTNILKKQDIVKHYQSEGFFVVYIGDGNNDAEAMRFADIGIACGIVHWPAISVMNICDFATFNTQALIRLLNQIKSEHSGTSVVICCAGIGSRLGLDQTKALVKLGDETLIERQLNNFSHMEDVRIVVGYQARDLIVHVNTIRKDVLFVLNHDYFHTKTGTSVYLGAKYGRENIFAIDGDLIIHPDDVANCLSADAPYLGVSQEKTQDGVHVRVNDCHQITSFTREQGDYEWSGPAFVKKDRISYVSGHLYTMFEPYLPMQYKVIRAFDIDTNEDYDKAKKIYNKWFLGNKKIHSFYDALAEKIQRPEETRNRSKDPSSFDIAFLKKYAPHASTLLDLAAGTGLVINALIDCFDEIVAVEKYEQFSNFITRVENVKIITNDLLEFDTDEKFDLVSIFGTMHLFNESETLKIYQKAFKFTKASGRCIIKHQMGLKEDVVIDGYSEELQVDYYAEYRHCEHEISLLKKAGFKDVEVIDIYPEEYNRWPNTHYFALVCSS